MSVTMTQVAREAGVSVGLVSRLLSNDPTLRISDDRRRQILHIEEKLGGVRRKSRRVVRGRGGRQSSQLTHTILTPINRRFSLAWVNAALIDSEAGRHLEAALRENGFHLHFNFFDPEEQSAFFRDVIQAGRNCDGLLLLSNMVDEELADLLRRHNFPHVSYAHDAEAYQLNTIRMHHSDGLRQAVEHLAEMGHRRIGFLGHAGFYRYPLFVAALIAAGLEFDEQCNCMVSGVIPDNQNAEAWRAHSRETMNAWLEEDRSATALVCTNDLFAQGALDALEARGLKAGVDLSLVGIDNLEVRGSLMRPDRAPRITTIDNPTDLIGRRAANLLLDQILHGQRQIVHERIPAKLIVRETTGPCPAAPRTRDRTRRA